MRDVTTLTQFLIKEIIKHNHLDADLAGVVSDMACACKIISHVSSRAALGSGLGSADSENVQGETQKKLDIIANDVIINSMQWTGRVAAMASEEMETIHQLPEGAPLGNYLVLFDPLDGSTNIDVNASTGTIFSIMRRTGTGKPTVEEFLRPGTEQICAGYTVYGPATVMLLTIGDGVHAFTLDRDIGEFVLTDSNVKIPRQASEFAINSSNNRFWEEPIKRYISECVAGKEGPRGKNFNMRWVGAMVADCHRVLSRGGVFLYPRDTKDPRKPSKLRLMYEANPIAFIAEQAGGMASTGRQRVLDVKPTGLHDRTPLILGSAEEVELATSYHKT